MTPEEKLLALIQQDKRQAVSVTPQEKLLALIEQDKRKPEPVAPAVSVVAPVVAPVQEAKLKVESSTLKADAGVSSKSEIPVQGSKLRVESSTLKVDAAAASKSESPSQEGAGVGSATAKSVPSSVVGSKQKPSPQPSPQPSPIRGEGAEKKVASGLKLAAKSEPVVAPAASKSGSSTQDPKAKVDSSAVKVDAGASSKSEIPSQEGLGVGSATAKSVTSPVAGSKQNPSPQPSPIRGEGAEKKEPLARGEGAEKKDAVPQPLLFPTVRVSGVTITNRVLAAVAMLILVAVFYSVAGAQRGIAEDVQKQIAGVGEMAVSPVTLPDVSVPAVDGLLEIVGRRNFFVPKLAEKDNSGAVVPVTAALTKDLKLVAISMDAAMASESMAIIKSKADSKTYFVKIGENVGDTEFVLTKVMADRIVLRQRKQEFELK